MTEKLVEWCYSINKGDFEAKHCVCGDNCYKLRIIAAAGSPWAAVRKGTKRARAPFQLFIKTKLAPVTSLFINLLVANIRRPCLLQVHI